MLKQDFNGNATSPENKLNKVFLTTIIVLQSKKQAAFQVLQDTSNWYQMSMCY